MHSFDHVLTYAGVMVPDIQEVRPTATTVIAAPGVLAAAFSTLTSFLFFAFINICMVGDNYTRREFHYNFSKLVNDNLLTFLGNKHDLTNLLL